MTGVTVSSIDERRYAMQVETETHALVADEPEDNGGDGLGLKPHELLLSALGACMAITLKMYAERKQWRLESVSVDLTHEKVAPQEPFFTAEEIGATSGGERRDLIQCEVRLGGELSQEERDRLLEIAGRCPIHRLLSATPKIVLVLADAS